MPQAIKEALQKCQTYADKGYALAKESQDNLHKTLLEEEKKLNKAKNEEHHAGRIEYADVLNKQMRELNQAKANEALLKKDLELLRERQKEFSIVVFGRTMAGKSTLMEILTHGNGTSIGKGAQRTTLDVRDYHWQGMRITDVPGICSFSGREDDALAMEAAKKADLILFLITDDAPQAEEAEKLADLRRLGKPVLGILNVKLAIQPNRRELTLRKLKNHLADTKRLDDICHQFRAYANQHQQDWQEIPFIYTHLRAAFLGQKSQENDDELFAVSNFSHVEDFILDKVQQDGCFLRIKTFVDCVAASMQEELEHFLRSSRINATEGLVYGRKAHDLAEWREKFASRIQKKFNNFCSALQQDIHNHIEDFVEDHYEGDIGEEWQEYMEQEVCLEKKCTTFLRDIVKQCEKKQRELTDDLRTEIRFTPGLELETELYGSGISDTQSWMQLGALGLFFVNPLAGIAVGLFSSLFGDSKATKIRKQKAEIREKLGEAMQPLLDNIAEQLAEKIREDIIGKGLNELQNVLNAASDRLIRLANDEASTAEQIGRDLATLNVHLWQEAENYTSISQPMDITALARIPGDCFLVLGDTTFPAAAKENVARLLGERVDYYQDSVERIHGNLLGDADCYSIGSEEEPLFSFLLWPKRGTNAHPLSLAEMEKTTAYRLAQQLIPYPCLEEGVVD